MTVEAYVVGVTTHIVEHGLPTRMLFAVLEETPEKALETVRTKVSATFMVDKHVTGKLSHDTARKLGLHPGQVKQL
jgi:hypothetical protein